MRDAILMGWIVIWVTVVAFVLTSCAPACENVQGVRSVCVFEF